ncbi:MAG TPA: diaminopimelate epimerase [Azospirillum sp.]|nr:diaminopimelate epimerase [Azospirillum sp.]
MAPVHFTKMHGCGNDFVLIDDRAARFAGMESRMAVTLCDRRFGIGADGLILLRRPGRAGAGLTMVFVNRDGLVGEMCGNGARCLAAFARRCGADGERLVIDTPAGLVTAAFDGALVRLSMTEPRVLDPDVRIEAGGRTLSFMAVDSGPPHAVTFVDAAALDGVDVDAVGRAVRHHPAFAPRGVNVNFAAVRDGRLHMRTYERGVEAETLACGTGAVACAAAASLRGVLDPPVTVVTRSGAPLTVSFRHGGGHFADVVLTGPAAFVATGTLDPGLVAAFVPEPAVAGGVS